MVVFQHVHHDLQNVWPNFTHKVVIQLILLRLRKNFLKHLLLVCKLIVSGNKAKVDVGFNSLLKAVQNFHKLVSLVVGVLVVRVLGRYGKAAKPLEQVSVLLVFKLLAEDDHFDENAADSPNVTPLSIALVRQYDLRRSVPPGHYSTSHFARVCSELLFLVLQ